MYLLGWAFIHELVNKVHMVPSFSHARFQLLPGAMELDILEI